MNGKSYATPEAFRAGLEAQAKKLRDEIGEGLDMVRRKLAFEAFLRRVTPSGAHLVLEGGYLLLGGSSRHSTMMSSASWTFRIDLVGDDETQPVSIKSVGSGLTGR